MTTASPLPFFVYGTLRRNQPNHRLLRNHVRRCEPASVSGYVLYDAGAFPYATASPGDRIVGELIHVQELSYPAVLASLDRLEGFRSDDRAGSHYVRVKCSARDAKGILRSAWVYVAGPRINLSKFPRHPFGDWAFHQQGGHLRLCADH